MSEKPVKQSSSWPLSVSISIWQCNPQSSPTDYTRTIKLAFYFTSELLYPNREYDVRQYDKQALLFDSYIRPLCKHDAHEMLWTNRGSQMFTRDAVA